MPLQVFQTFTEHIWKGKGIISLINQDENELLEFRVFDKATGKMLPQHYQADGLSFVHSINAYEDQDGNIILDSPLNNKKPGFDFVMMEVLKGDNIANRVNAR